MVNGVGETDRDQIVQALVGPGKSLYFILNAMGSHHRVSGRGEIQLVDSFKKSLWLLCEPEVNEYTMKLMGSF